MKGKLIVFEGTDGSGKATQSKLLFERLQREEIWKFVQKKISFLQQIKTWGIVEKCYVAPL